jgi:hypothetical protein
MVLLLLGTEIRFLDHPACDIVFAANELPWLQKSQAEQENTVINPI